MNYIYSGGYKALLFALYLKNLGNEISIISPHEGIIKYCADVKINCIKLRLVKPTVFSTYKLLTLKKELDKIIESINFGKDDAFYLASARTKGYPGFYLAKELSKKQGRIYHANPSGVDFEEYTPPWYKPIFFRGIIFRWKLKRFLDLDLKYYTGSNNIPIIGIDDKFKVKYDIKDYPLDHFSGEMLLEIVKKNKYSDKKCDSLIIDQGSFGEILKPGSLEKMYRGLSEIPIEFAFKKYPQTTKYNPAYESLKHCYSVPRYVPVELFLNNVERNVVSIFSASLITASNLEHLKAISLVNLVEFNDPSFKNKVKDWLIEESGNKILFPNSFGELRTILLK